MDELLAITFWVLSSRQGTPRPVQSPLTQSLFIASLLLLGWCLTGCDQQSPWNDPHVDEDRPANTLYTTFSSRPKTLDPAKAYSSNAYRLLGLIYEPPLQYHPTAKPYQLIPRTAKTMPKVQYLNANHQPLANDQYERAAYTRYIITIQPGLYYQPHPALARDQQGRLLHGAMRSDTLSRYHNVNDIQPQGSRELTAKDYVYEIKRLADPKVASPIYGVMAEHILGFKAFNAKLKRIRRHNPEKHIDLRRYDLQGVRTLGRYRYQITLRGRYRQFRYWLAMPFFAPMPWEVDQFYAQSGMVKQNFNLDWYPVGTDPYYLIANNPNLHMVLTANPNYYSKKRVPADWRPKHKSSQHPPYSQQIVFKLERENIPRWNKFLQGYYDQSTVTSDSFNQAIRVNNQGKPRLTDAMADQGLQLQTAVQPAIYYFGFNMLDPVVGGYDNQSRELRQAIALTLDYSRYITIFLNGRAQLAHSPIPPGIFGHEVPEQGYDPTIYQWQNGELQRRSLQQAKRLLTQAGYPHGINPQTGKRLVLHYDAISTGDPGQKAIFDWLREQFAQLGIQLSIRATHYNRFQEKMNHGNVQMFSWGWNADYPDPENFLFLFYGPNAKVKHGGENAANYHNKKFDQLFRRMRNLPNNAKRRELIDKMVSILQHDQPWVWGFYPKSFLLSHQWVNPVPLNPLTHSSKQYLKLNPQLRQTKQRQWNKPILWPLAVIVALIGLASAPVVISYWYQTRLASSKRRS